MQQKKINLTQTIAFECISIIFANCDMGENAYAFKHNSLKMYRTLAHGI